MVLGEAAAFTAAGAHALFGYNRENFMYDRKQRQEAEFKVLEWRSTQAELWRDDVREVIGLTEKKMDTYLIVNTLQLGMCVGLFSEGRLEPGTPPWLLHLYMLTLSAAFLYLLMSVWLAMHASVVASCSSVRLLTQFVRLPVPTWQQLESMRTYAQTVESLEPQQLLRVPFTGRRNSSPSVVETVPKDATSKADSRSSNDKADPWNLEPHGDVRGLYELAQQPAELRRHICLAQRAAKQYQAFDAFARVSMSFGTNQLLNAISYYVMGYVAIQDGAPFPACCVTVIMMGIALGLVHIDFSMTRKEVLLARLLVCVGPLTSSVASFIWALRGPNSETAVMGMLPLAYAAHGLWLYFAMNSCGLQLQPNGSVLPMRFRAILYLDVFGWLHQEKQQQEQKEQELEATVDASGKPRLPPGQVCESSVASSVNLEHGIAEDARRQRDRWGAAGCVSKGTASTRTPYSEDCSGVESSPLTTTPLLTETPKTLPSELLAAIPPLPGQGPICGPSGEHKEMPEDAFTATSYTKREAADASEEVELVTGHDKMDPGRAPAKVFRLGTTLLILLWATGMALPVGVFREFMTKPLTADVFVEEIAGVDSAKKHGAHPPTEVPRQPRMRGRPTAAAPSVPVIDEDTPKMPEGEIVQAAWPSHSGFVPRSLSCDPTGTHLVVADDLGVFSGRLGMTLAVEEDHSSSRAMAKAKRTLLDAPAKAHADAKAPAVAHAHAPRKVLGVDFERLDPCTALEGQELKDVSVVCTGKPHAQTCRVVVLHARGRRLAQCPLPLGEEGNDDKSLTDKKGAFKSMLTWTISSDWLRGSRSKHPEHVESFAVNSECLDSDDVAPSREVGCVVVGTSSGRIVQLRGAYKDRSLLIPERAMQQRERIVARGTLHVFGNGLVVALRRGSGTLEAFNGELGTRVGTWRLPSNVDWLMLCGGGESIFVLGIRDHRHKELHRFPLPAELKVGSLAEAAESFALSGRAHEV